MVEITYQMVLSTFQTVGILVGIVYYLWIMRNTQKTRELTLRSQEQALETRQVQLFNHVYDKWTNPDYWEIHQDIMNNWNWTDPEDFMRKYGPEQNPEAWDKLMATCGPYEYLGLLVHYELMEPKMIWNFFAYIPCLFWEKIEPVIVFYREEYESEPKGYMCEWTEYLSLILREEQKKDLVDLSRRIAEKNRLRERLSTTI